jgi:uncharacterized membrane protein YGL010W
MRPLSIYLNEYAQSHQNRNNQLLHSICVPLITWSILGVLHSYVITQNIRASYIFAAFAIIYYSCFKKILVTVSMALFSAISLFSFQFVPNLFWTSLIVFGIAWVGQFYGHHLEGKRPSFLKDLTFLLIGPIWVIKKFFPKIDYY